MTQPPPDPGQPYVVIGLKEVYDAVLRLQAIVQGQTSRQDDHAHDLADHETRLRVIEGRRWPLPTLVAVLSFVALLVAIASVIVMLTKP